MQYAYYLLSLCKGIQYPILNAHPYHQQYLEGCLLTVDTIHLVAILQYKWDLGGKALKLCVLNFINVHYRSISCWDKYT